VAPRRVLGGALPTPARWSLAKRTSQRAVPFVVTGQTAHEPLVEPVLTHHATGPSLFNPERLSSMTTARRRAFGLEVSLGDPLWHRVVKGEISDDSLQATVLGSSSFRRLASFAFMPPYWAFQRCQVDSAISSCRQTSASSSPWLSNLSPSGELADDLFWGDASSSCCPPGSILEHRTLVRGGSFKGTAQLLN